MRNGILSAAGLPSPDGGGLGRGDLFLVEPKFLSDICEHQITILNNKAVLKTEHCKSLLPKKVLSLSVFL